MSLSQLFTNNSQYLNKVAVRITRCKDYRRAPDLLSSTYLTLYEKNCDYPKDNEGFIKWFSKCMKNYFTWTNSEFNQTYNPKEKVSYDVDANDNMKKHLDSRIENTFKELIIDEDALKDIENGAEEVNEHTKELFEISSNLGKNKTLRFIETVEFVRTLDPHERILFELYFEKELSTRKIAELYSDSLHKMNYQSVNIMVNKIKSKIKQYKWKQ